MLSVADVARRLSVSEPVVRKWIKEGRLRAVRLGAKLYRITEAALADFLAAGERDATTGPPAPARGRRARAVGSGDWRAELEELTRRH